MFRIIIYRESLSIENDYLQRVKEHIDGGAGDVQMNEDIQTYPIYNLDYVNHHYNQETNVS